MADAMDLFLDEDEDETPVQPQKNPVAEQRKHIKELEKTLKEWEPELEELRRFKTEQTTAQREAVITETFTSLGLPTKASKFYKLENPDGEISKEAVAKWAVENEFATPDQFSSAEPTDQGFSPTTHGEGFVPGLKRYSRKEFEKLLSTGNAADQIEANRAIEQGRVDLDKE